MSEIKTKKLKVTFCGGVSTVTGANFLVENFEEDPGRKVKLLIDCGMEQGTRTAEDYNRKPFIFDPASINYLLVTHAHIDHVGLIPKLVRDGFRGKIFSTPETRRLAPIMLEDSMRLMMRDEAERGIPHLFEMVDIEVMKTLWQDVQYGESFELHGGFKIFVKDAGHILGSAMYEIMYNGKKIVFTGDLGNSPTPLLRDTEPITGATYLVLESVYGDRNHEDNDERRFKLKRIVGDAIKRGGALLIPAFSLEKTQVILYELNELIEKGEIPRVPVFLDSPLSIKVTEIYRDSSANFNKKAGDEMKIEDIFDFPGLRLTESSDDSKEIINIPNPKIIIAGSGMSNGGRILHHEANYLGDKKSTLLLIGYQSLGTLGRRIEDGEKHIRIYGADIHVKAFLEKIDGYSSHKDSDHLVEFIATSKDTLKKVFPVMGEPKSALFLCQKVKDNLGLDAYHPESGESIELEF